MVQMDTAAVPSGNKSVIYLIIQKCSLSINNKIVKSRKAGSKFGTRRALPNSQFKSIFDAVITRIL